MPNYPYTFQLPPLNVQDIPNDGVAGEFLGINGSGQLDWLTAGGTGDMLKADNLSGLASYPTARTNLGLGTGDSPTFANLTLTSPSLVSSAPVTISQTWGNNLATFKALVVNAAGTSDANSASGSLLLDLQVGGVSKFKVNKAGAATMVSATIGTAFISSIGFSASYIPVSGGFDMTGGLVIGNYSASLGYLNGLTLRSNYFVGWSNTSSGIDTPDTILLRDAANTLALRNGANAQTFRVYNTFPGNGNNEFGSLNWVDQPNEFQITTGQAGGGTGRALCLRAGGGINIRIGGAPGTLVWQFGTSTGHFLAATDNSVDIGASGANRPRNVYVGTNVISRPAASITPANNGEFVVEATSNTTLTFKLKGTDGTVRSGTITLA